MPNFLRLTISFSHWWMQDRHTDNRTTDHNKHCWIVSIGGWGEQRQLTWMHQCIVSLSNNKLDFKQKESWNQLRPKRAITSGETAHVIVDEYNGCPRQEKAVRLFDLTISLFIILITLMCLIWTWKSPSYLPPHFQNDRKKEKNDYTHILYIVEIVSHKKTLN